MTTRAIVDWLEATVVSDLGVTCQKSMPAFDRPDIATGAYIGWEVTTGEYGARVSASLDKWETQVSLLVITANEVAVLAMVDLLEAMAATRTEATISNARVRVRFAALQRADNSIAIEALRYAVSTTVQFMR